MSPFVVAAFRGAGCWRFWRCVVECPQWAADHNRSEKRSCPYEPRRKAFSKHSRLQMLPNAVGVMADHPLLQRVPGPAALADLRQVVVAGQLSQMRFDRIAVRPRGFLDFLDRDFSSRLCEFQYLT